MTSIPTMPEIPHARDAATKRVHEGIKEIVRRIVIRAVGTNHDLLFSVYCAGLAHGAAISQEWETDQ